MLVYSKYIFIYVSRKIKKRETSVKECEWLKKWATWKKFKLNELRFLYLKLFWEFFSLWL